MKPCEVCGEWRDDLWNGMCDECREQCELEFALDCDETEDEKWRTVIDLANSV